MRFEWDEDKDRRNREKHGLGFETAMGVFDDPLRITSFDRLVDGEERFWAIGALKAKLTAIAVVVYTIRRRRGEEVIRIISARNATRTERTAYEDEDIT